jgi:uncharacterized integral membrane protein
VTACPRSVMTEASRVTTLPAMLMKQLDRGAYTRVTDHVERMVMTYQGQQGPGDTTTDGADRRRRLSGGAIASLSGVGVLVVFMIQNTEDVTVDFLFWSFTSPLWLLILVAAVIGAFVWFGLGVLRRHQRRKERREARRD